MDLPSQKERNGPGRYLLNLPGRYYFEYVLDECEARAEARMTSFQKAFVTQMAS